MATGWEMERDAFKNGGGTYWVPDPSPGTSCEQLLIEKGKAALMRVSVSRRLPEFSTAANRNAIMEIVAMLGAKVEKYEAAIQACYVASTPVPVAGSTEPVQQVNKEVNNEPLPAQASNKKIWLIGGGIAFVLIVTVVVIKMKRAGK